MNLCHPAKRRGSRGMGLAGLVNSPIACVPVDGRPAQLPEFTHPHPTHWLKSPSVSVEKRCGHLV